MTGTFDVVVINLYPFYDKVTAPGGISFEDGIENIDIGGAAMIKAVAKVYICAYETYSLYSYLDDKCCWTEPQRCPHRCRFRGLSSCFGVSQRSSERPKNSAGNLRGRPFSTLLLMIPLSQNGYGSRLRDVGAYFLCDPPYTRSRCSGFQVIHLFSVSHIHTTVTFEVLIC